MALTQGLGAHLGMGVSLPLAWFLGCVPVWLSRCWAGAHWSAKAHLLGVHLLLLRLIEEVAAPQAS